LKKHKVISLQEAETASSWWVS